MIARQAKVYSCPVEVAIEVIGAKWAAVILAHLKDRTLRYGELRRLMPRTSEKMLTQRLRDLEAAGLVRRDADDEVVPTRVDYILTDLGRTLAPTLEALYDWGTTWAALHGLVIAPPPRKPPQEA